MLQLLHACGLLRGSFRPGDESVGCVPSFVNAMALWSNVRIGAAHAKSLDQMNVCVHHAVSDITGVTGMGILHAIVDGNGIPMLHICAIAVA